MRNHILVQPNFRMLFILFDATARGRGKTPIGQIIAMAIAEFWKEEFPDLEPPSFRLTSDIDFLRGVVGSRSCVDMVDDADSPTIPIRKLKALLDVSLLEATTKERWNCCKWVGNRKLLRRPGCSG